MAKTIQLDPITRLEGHGNVIHPPRQPARFFALRPIEQSDARPISGRIADREHFAQLGVRDHAEHHGVLRVDVGAKRAGQARLSGEAGQAASGAGIPLLSGHFPPGKGLLPRTPGDRLRLCPLHPRLLLQKCRIHPQKWTGPETTPSP